MIHPVADMRSAVRRARFDPRLVVVGFVLMFLAAFGGFALAQTIASKADKVITPVAHLCRANTAASVELTSAGACAAADSARTAGPYVITKAGAPGEDGTPGAPGTPGAAGEDGKDGIGRDGKDGAEGKAGTDGTPGEDGAEGEPGEDGEPGSSPPCLDEPGGCRGADGAPGTPGADGADGAPGAPGAQGPPGPTCPPGTALEPVTFASGEEGLGCVSEPADPEPTTPAEAP